MNKNTLVQSEGIQNAILVPNTRRSYTYIDNGEKYFYKSIHFDNPNINRPNFELLSELYLSRIAKNFYNFDTPIYNVARYVTAKGERLVGVSSKDLTPGFSSLTNLVDISGVYRNNLRLLKRDKILDNLTENARKQLVYSILFEIVTMQRDMTGGNVIFGTESGSKKFSSVILLDYGRNDISLIDTNIKKSIIDDIIDYGGSLFLGIEEDMTHYSDALDELTYSKLLKTSDLEEFIEAYGESKKIENAINKASSDIDLQPCVNSDQYAEMLEYSMKKMTSLLEHSLTERRKCLKGEIDYEL